MPNRTLPCLLAAALSVAIVTACSDDGTESASLDLGSAPPIQPIPTTTATVDTTTAAPDLPGKIVVRGTDSTCTSATPSTGPVDLLGVDVHLGVAGYAGTAARVTWKLSGPLPITGTALLSLMGANQDGSVTEQLGYKILDGSQIGYYVFDSSGQTNLSGYPDASVPNEVSGVMPSAPVDALGPDWHWTAALNIDGQDVDTCPS